MNAATAAVVSSMVLDLPVAPAEHAGLGLEGSGDGPRADDEQRGHRHPEVDEHVGARELGAVGGGGAAAEQAAEVGERGVVELGGPEGAVDAVELGAGGGERPGAVGGRDQRGGDALAQRGAQRVRRVGLEGVREQRRAAGAGEPGGHRVVLRDVRLLGGGRGERVACEVGRRPVERAAQQVPAEDDLAEERPPGGQQLAGLDGAEPVARQDPDDADGRRRVVSPGQDLTQPTHTTRVGGGCDGARRPGPTSEKSRYSHWTSGKRLSQRARRPTALPRTTM